MIYWPQAFFQPFAAAGYRVIRFDNRDVGLSSKLDDLGKVDIMEVLAKLERGEEVSVPYTLADMALDIVGLMEALDIAQAHIVGMSLGGMVTQVLAANHPDRVLTMTSIMSSSGNPELPSAAPEILETLTSPPSDADDRQAKIDDEVRSMLLTGSPGYPISEEFARELASRAYDRCYHPDGVHRQMAAARATGDRRPLLHKIKCPALVIHGRDDVLVPPTSGRDTADNIPGADYVEIAGMGHDIPPSLAPKLAGLVLNHLTFSV